MLLSAPIALLLSLAASAKAQDTFFCEDTLTASTNCLIENNLDYNEDYSAVDDAACTECFTNNNFFENPAVYETCDGATSDICGYFDACHDVCYPKSSVCQQELYDYYVCVFGAALAPENCIVQCEGSSPTSDGADNEGDKSGTSGASIPTAITAFSSVLLLGLAGLLL